MTQRVRRNLVFAGAAALFLVVGWIGGGVWGHLDQEPVPVLAAGAAPGQTGNREVPPAPVVEPAPVVPAPAAAPPVTSTKPAASTKRAPKTTSKTPSASPDARADTPTATPQNPVAILLSQQWTQFGTSWPQSGAKNRGGYQYWGFGR
ncbi:hypothetical protein GKO32_33225 [Amycolatopsis sp. RM579]|uniref:Uncharacterized protein n=1 Tax=Amycolatopsis pithecellobii TaxID=664692 RepID=A0A6N7ZAU1_9PSEU|nr:hypothetical protein [Amycolatopsis pithecellobii]